MVTDLGPVVGTHTGPGTIGVCMVTRARPPAPDGTFRQANRPVGLSSLHGSEARLTRFPTPRPANALGDLPTRGADWVDTVVELLRDRTVRPLTLATRAVVFGIIVFAAAVVTVVLLSITLIRLLTVYAFDGRVWLSDLVVGVLFVALGIVAWSPALRSQRRRPRARHDRVPPGGDHRLRARRADRGDLRRPGPAVPAGHRRRARSTSDQPGGQLMLTTEVENFPGFVNGIMGPELMQAFREQAARFGADYVTAKVIQGRPVPPAVRVWVGDPDAAEPTYAADALIISTGAQSLMLNLPNEERLLGYGVSTCATCDGFFFREREIAVVGGGDSALEEALFLTRFADKVTVIHRRGELRASKVMQQRAFANEKITFLWNTSVIDVLGENTVTGVRIRDNESEEESVLELAGPLRGHRAPAQHRPVQGPARDGGERLPAHLRRDRGPTSTGCSPAVTSRTTGTGRPSPRPDRAAWPPWTSSGGSRTSSPAH